MSGPTPARPDATGQNVSRFSHSSRWAYAPIAQSAPEPARFACPVTSSLVQRAATHVQDLLASRRGPPWVALLAILISLPALRLGFMADDHLLAAQLEHGDGPWGLFAASQESLQELRTSGALAWWASPRLALQFFRPLASLSHDLDFRWWPQAAWLMTLWNVLLYGLCALLAALLYRRLLPSPRVAGLAALLFTVNEAHAMSVGWISGRNTVLALLGSLAALYCHVRARQERRAGLSTLSVALALLSAEAGTWALGMLLAYALVLEPGTLRARLLSIAPQLAVAAVWASVYLAMGSGVRGSHAAILRPRCRRPLRRGASAHGPGFHGLQRMSTLLLAERVPDDARLLVLGAGGGLELQVLIRYPHARPGPLPILPLRDGHVPRVRGATRRFERARSASRRHADKAGCARRGVCRHHVVRG